MRPLRPLRSTIGVITVLVAASTPADGATPVLTRVSVASDGTAANHTSGGAAVSADGRFVAFFSAATNLDPQCTNGFFHVYVHDRVSRTTTCVSVASDGTEGDSESSHAVISADGRVVAFRSNAANLVPGDTNGFSDVFVRDRLTGMTTRVSVASDGTQADGHSGIPFAGRAGVDVSADGRLVAFPASATNLVPGDTNDGKDVFVRDRLAGTTTRVNLASDGTQAIGHSDLGALSPDGRFVAFHTQAANLVAGDTNAVSDVFVRDRLTGTTTRESVASEGAQANGPSHSPTISTDGRFVAFTSVATNLVAGDDNGLADIFVRDRLLGTTTRAIAFGGDAVLSADGRFIAFASPAAMDGCIGTLGQISLLHVFRHDRATGITRCLTGGVGPIDVGTNHPAINGDGRIVVFVARAPGDLLNDHVYAARLDADEDLPVTRRYDGDTRADIAVFRPSTGSWLVLRSTDDGTMTQGWGSAALGDLPAPADYDGDGRADVAVYRGTTGEWFIHRSSDGGLTHLGWGAPAATALGDSPALADYDGDGKADIAVNRGTTGEWFILRSTDGGLTHVAWGSSAHGDIPVPADYDGDSKADIAVYRASTGEWFVRRSTDGALFNMAWGSPAHSDVPVPADYDGDTKADIAVYRRTTGEWFVRRSSDTGLSHVAWGAPAATGLGDVPVPADYDGDGQSDVAVHRASTGEWFMLGTASGASSLTFP